MILTRSKPFDTIDWGTAQGVKAPWVSYIRIFVCFVYFVYFVYERMLLCLAKSWIC